VNRNGFVLEAFCEAGRKENASNNTGNKSFDSTNRAEGYCETDGDLCT
jgi:hypothetical protein